MLLRALHLSCHLSQQSYCSATCHFVSASLPPFMRPSHCPMLSAQRPVVTLSLPPEISVTRGENLAHRRDVFAIHARLFQKFGKYRGPLLKLEQNRGPQKRRPVSGQRIRHGEGDDAHYVQATKPAEGRASQGDGG